MQKQMTLSQGLMGTRSSIDLELILPNQGTGKVSWSSQETANPPSLLGKSYNDVACHSEAGSPSSQRLHVISLHRLSYKLFRFIPITIN